MTALRIFHCDVRTVWAGGQNQLFELALGLRERGHRQWIVTRPDSPLARRARDNGLDVLAHPYRGEIDPRGIANLARLIRRCRPDIVHAHDPHSLTPAAIAARCTRPRPRVVAHRRVDFHIRPHRTSRWKYARGPDRLIAVSRRVRDVLVEDGVPADRITVIHSGIDLVTPPPPEGPGLRERIATREDAPLVLTIASAEDYKDHPTLIDAAEALRERVPPTHWVVLGQGGLLQTVRAQVTARGLDDRLHYLGFVRGARGFLPQADVFVLTSKTEGLGTSVLDAMAAGVPVVATAAGGIPEMIEDGMTGLLAPVGDGRGIAERIDALLDDRRRAAALAAAARERVAAFDVGRTIARTEAVYLELV